MISSLPCLFLFCFVLATLSMARLTYIFGGLVTVALWDSAVGAPTVFLEKKSDVFIPTPNGTFEFNSAKSSKALAYDPKTQIIYSTGQYIMSRVMRNPAFCICENKDADQLRGSREADQRLCFRYIASAIPLLSKYKISSL